MFGRVQLMSFPVNGYRLLPWSGYWAPNFPGGSYPNSIWRPTPGNSSSISGNNGALIAGATAPGIGTVLAGFSPAHFNAVISTELTSDETSTPNKTITDYIAASSGGLFMMVKPSNTGATATGNTYDDTPLLIDTNADFGMTFSTLGLAGFAYDGAYKIAEFLTLSASAWHVCAVTYDGSNITLRCDSQTPKSVACSTLTIFTGALQIGLGYGAAHNYSGDIMEIGFFKGYAPTTTDYNNYKSYVNTTYGLSL